MHAKPQALYPQALYTVVYTLSTERSEEGRSRPALAMEAHRYLVSLTESQLYAAWDGGQATTQQLMAIGGQSLLTKIGHLKQAQRRAEILQRLRGLHTDRQRAVDSQLEVLHRIR